MFGRSAKRGQRTSSKGGAARRLTCGEVMEQARMLPSRVSMNRVLRTLTKHNLDHIFLVDEDGVPVGRVHAVDMLKLIQRKAVNRDLAWMQAVEASQLISQPPLQVIQSTPLLKAAALMLAHDLNQIAVVDDEGCLVGVVGHSLVARHLPKFIL